MAHRPANIGRLRRARPSAALARVLAPAIALCLLLALPAAGFAHDVAEGDKAFVRSIDGPAIIPFLYLGAKHMVTGYDHIAFLIGVVFFLRRLREVVVYVSLFTIGHSTTLLLGTLLGVGANSYVIDAIIGLSVVYKGLENTGAFARIGWTLDTRVAVLVFGLFHGLGLATKLRDLDMSPDGLLANLVAFNVGVEIGQVMVLAVVVVVLDAWAPAAQLCQIRIRRQCGADRRRIAAHRFPDRGISDVMTQPFASSEDQPLGESDGRSGGRTRLLVGGGIVVAIAAVLVLFVLPAETGFDPLGVGAATGLDKIAKPDSPELERGMARMQREEVLTLADSPPAPAAGVTDSWEYELAPYESVEFKYTLPAGQPLSFRWEATAPLEYDMHAHPFEGGTDLTESYAIDEARAMSGTYTPAFTGEHGWYWSNRSADAVTLKLTATGAMTTSTIYSGATAFKRPIEGASDTIGGSVEGHRMQSDEAQ